MFSLSIHVLALAIGGPPIQVESPDAACTCAAVQQTDGWCAKCRVGYLAGVKIESASFFEALDAHGHQINPQRLVCDRCRKAYESFGYCDQCKFGFVGKQAYFSKLTYLLARGELREVNSISCPTCRKHVENAGWCDECRVGMVHTRAYRDRQEFEQAVTMRKALRVAIAQAEKCLTCALAMINDSTCVECQATYRDGARVPPPSPAP